MSRVKIKFPDQKPLFTATVPVRIVDINYGGHLGNDRVLAVMHEARMQAFAANGYSEMNAGGNSLIMADAMLAFRGESFYGDLLLIDIYVDEISDMGFDLLYKITTQRAGAHLEIANGKTAMVCFDYTSRKVSHMTDELRLFLTQTTTL